MPAPFGVVPTGFNSKTLEEILTEIQDSQLANISPTLDLATESPLGQINGIVSAQLRELWELAEACYHGFDPDGAVEAQLTVLSLLTGTERRPATNSTVTCSCTFAAGTYGIGSLIAHVNGNPDARFANTVSVTTLGGIESVPFAAEDTGPIAAPAGQLNVIAEPVVGWLSVTNPLDAAIGSDIESDAALRNRRLVELSTAGSESVGAIRAEVSGVPDVLSVQVLENVTDAIDANGLPPHSFEVLLRDAGADDNAIAQAIWDSKPAGIQAFGTGESGTAVDDAGGDQIVEFSRITVRDVYLEIDLDVDTVTYGAGGDQAVKEAVATYGDANFGIGEDIVLAALYAAIFSVTGVNDVLAIRAGFAALPTGTVNLGIALREVGDLDTSRIVVDSTP
jgi:uncharacterized phage protein gp47/JayE